MAQQNAGSRALALAQPHADLPTTAEWELLQRMCAAFEKSNLYGHIHGAAQFIAIAQTGRELGVPPSAALRGFSIIKGKPTASAELLAALCQRDHGDQALRVVLTTNEECVVRYKRRGWDESGEIRFTMADAKRAGLLDKKRDDSGPSNWEKFPRAMLRSRAISEAARTAFQDSILGMHTPEELAPDRVIVTDDGEVIVADSPPGTDDDAPPAATGALVDGGAPPADARPANVTPMTRKGQQSSEPPTDEPPATETAPTGPNVLPDTPARLDWISTLELAGRLDPKIGAWVREKPLRSRNDTTLGRAAANASARIDESLARWQDAAREMQQRCALGVANKEDDKAARHLVQWASLLRGEHPDTARYAAANTPQTKLIDVVEEFWGVLGPEADEEAPDAQASAAQPATAPVPAAQDDPDLVPF